MGKRILGLDVGTYSVKVVHVETKNRSAAVQPIAYAEKKLGLAQEDFANKETVQARQSAVLKQLQLEGALYADVSVSGLSGLVAQVRPFQFPFNDAKKIEAILPGELESQIPLDIDDLSISWYAEQEKVGDSYRVMVAFAKKEAIASYLGSLEEVELNPRILSLKSFALFDICRHIFKEEGYYIAVDIGHTSTNMCVYNEKGVVQTRSILRGGLDITKHLADKLKMPFEQAEIFKHKEAFLEVGAEKSDSVEKHLASETLKEALLPIVREIRQSIFAVQAEKGVRLKGVHLFGGTALLRNLEPFLSEELSLPVQKAQNLGISASYGDPIQAALAMGYALSGATPSKKENQVNFRRKEFAYRTNFKGLSAASPLFIIWPSVIVLLLMLYAGVDFVVAGKEVLLLKNQEEQACLRIAGKKEGNCLPKMRQMIAKAELNRIPPKDAADYYLEVARYMPNTVSVKVVSLEVTLNTLQVAGETGNLDDVEAIRKALALAPCFKQIEKGESNPNNNGGVDFSLSMQIKCGQSGEG